MKIFVSDINKNNDIEGVKKHIEDYCLEDHINNKKLKTSKQLNRTKFSCVLENDQYEKLKNLESGEHTSTKAFAEKIIISYLDQYKSLDLYKSTEVINYLNEKNIFKVTLDNMVWDGVNRLDDFFNTIEVDDEFIQVRNLFLLKWCQQMLRQSLCGGYENCEKNILVLSGKQNIGKSTWIKSLLPTNLQQYIGQNIVLTAKDNFNKFAMFKNIIVELTHFDLYQIDNFFGGIEDTIKFKYIDEQIPFEKKTTSFIVTTDENTLYKDISGSVRFLTIPVNKLNGLHNIDMLQLYKEILTATDYVKLLENHKGE